MKKILLLILLIGSLIYQAGCVSKLEYKPSPKLDFPVIPPYENKVELKKPEVIKPIWVDKNYKPTDIKQANFAVLNQKEYSKINALVQLNIAKQDIINEQSNLINIYIRQINAYNEFLKLEQLKSEEYKQLWVDAENNRREAIRDSKIDSIIYKSTILFLLTGFFILAL